MKLIALPILATTLFAGCLRTPSYQASCCRPPQGETAASVSTISAEQAYRMMSESTDLVVLDVRTEQEFRERRIEGALLIPHDEIRVRAKNMLPNKNQTILVYCRTGRRSAIAAGELVGLGYVNVYDFGGITTWPYDTVGD